MGEKRREIQQETITSIWIESHSMEEKRKGHP
jgi:hypothetical protein